MPNVVAFSTPQQRELNADMVELRMMLSTLQDKYGHEGMARLVSIELLVLLLGEQVTPSEHLYGYFSNLAWMFRAERNNERRA
jgi:hypothetical protein